MSIDPIQALPAATHLIHQLFYYLDEANHDALLALFEVDGVWHRQGHILRGHGAILQAMQQRSPTQRIRHVITNTLIAASTAQVVQLVGYMTAYRFDDGALHTGSVPISQALRLSVLRAALSVRDGKWRIAELSLTPEFEFVAS